MRKAAYIAIALVVTVIAATVALRSAPPPAVSRSAPTTVVAAMKDDLAWFEMRAQQDVWSAADRSELARLYLQRGRERREYADFQRPERSAWSSLELRRSRN